MTTLTISVPDEVQAFLEAQSVREGHATVEAYLRSLIREARKRQVKRDLEARLQEAFESGPAEPMTREDWEAIEREALDRLARESATR